MIPVTQHEMKLSDAKVIEFVWKGPRKRAFLRAFVCFSNYPIV
jgi:hypothetical protein